MDAGECRATEHSAQLHPTSPRGPGSRGQRPDLAAETTHWARTGRQRHRTRCSCQTAEGRGGHGHSAGRRVKGLRGDFPPSSLPGSGTGGRLSASRKYSPESPPPPARDRLLRSSRRPMISVPSGRSMHQGRRSRTCGALEVLARGYRPDLGRGHWCRGAVRPRHLWCAMVYLWHVAAAGTRRRTLCGPPGGRG